MYLKRYCCRECKVNNNTDFVLYKDSCIVQCMKQQLKDKMLSKTLIYILLLTCVCVWCVKVTEMTQIGCQVIFHDYNTRLISFVKVNIQDRVVYIYIIINKHSLTYKLLGEGGPILTTYCDDQLVAQLIRQFLVRGLITNLVYLCC